MTQIVLLAPTTSAIAAGTNAINYNKDFPNVEVVGVQATPKEVPFPDVLSLFRDVHHRAQRVLREYSTADIAVIFTNELVSFRDSLATRVTFSVGMVLVCFRDGGGVRLTVQGSWVPETFHKHVDKMGDMFEGEMQEYFERLPKKDVIKSAAAITANLQAVVNIPVIERRDIVH